MTTFGTYGLADLRRWAICGAVVMLAHGGIAAAMVWREPINPSEPAAAIVVHFAPVPVAPTALDTDVPPGPEQVASEASPSKRGEVLEETIEEQRGHKIETRIEPKIEERIELKSLEEPPLEVPPAPDPHVTVAALPPSQEVKQESQQQQRPSELVPMTTAPQALPVEIAPEPAAPEQGPLKPSDAKAVQAWQKQIVALIERNKRYPPDARPRRQQGVAEVFFSIDRQGRVLESRVVRSSGAAPLDEEALAVVRRSQPFPAWPAGAFTRDTVTMTLPLRFDFR